jgi:hypothetical protein
MTETKLRQFVVSLIAAGVGSVRGDAWHKSMLATYNAYKPLPRGHKMLESEHYCAATVSATWIKAGVDVVAVVECSCTRMMELAKAKGIWVEDDKYIPKPGDAVIYDWQDDGKGDNKGVPDHVGIVERVDGNSMTIIEGNRPVGHVARHQLAVNGRYIRGFICPRYSDLAEPEPVKPKTVYVQLPVLRKGSSGDYVRTLQILLNKYNRASLAEDGVFGVKTLLAVKVYQKSRKLSSDGVVGVQTWSKLLQ